MVRNKGRIWNFLQPQKGERVVMEETESDRGVYSMQKRIKLLMQSFKKQQVKKTYRRWRQN